MNCQVWSLLNGLPYCNQQYMLELLQVENSKASIAKWEDKQQPLSLMYNACFWINHICIVRTGQCLWVLEFLPLLFENKWNIFAFLVLSQAFVTVLMMHFSGCAFKCGYSTFFRPVWLLYLSFVFESKLFVLAQFEYTDPISSYSKDLTRCLLVSIQLFNMCIHGLVFVFSSEHTWAFILLRGWEETVIYKYRRGRAEVIACEEQQKTRGFTVQLMRGQGMRPEAMASASTCS